MAVNEGMKKLIAAVRRKHPKLPQLPAHPSTKRAPAPVVARYRLHAPGAPPAGTTDKMLAPIVNGKTMQGYAKTKAKKRRVPAGRATARRAPMAPMHCEVEIEITINGVKHTARSVSKQADAREDAAEGEKD